MAVIPTLSLYNEPQFLCTANICGNSSTHLTRINVVSKADEPFVSEDVKVCSALSPLNIVVQRHLRRECRVSPRKIKSQLGMSVRTKGALRFSSIHLNSLLLIAEISFATKVAIANLHETAAAHRRDWFRGCWTLTA